MSVMTMLAVVLDEVAGNRGSVRNCRDEISRRRRDEEAVEHLLARIPAVEHPARREHRA